MSVPRILAFLIAVAAAACQREPPTLEPLAQPTRLEAAPPRISGAIPSNEGRLPVFEARGAGAAPRAPGSAASAAIPGPGGDVTLNFVDTDIREVARTILGKTLRLNYTVDPAVKGTATFESGTPLSPPELLSALETMLNQNGATLTERNGIYAVVPIAVAGATNTVASASTPGAGTQVVALRYASAAQLAKVLEPYVAEGGKISPDPGRNALIVRGDAAVRKALTDLIRAFDVDALAGQSFALFPVGDGDPGKLAAALEKVLHAEGEGSLAGVVRVIPLERANAVLVASAQPRYLDAARRFFRLAGRAEDATARTWHVYYVKNGRSADLEPILRRAFAPRSAAAAPAEAPITAPGAQPVVMGPGAQAQTGALGGAGARMGSAAAGGLAGPAATTPMRSTAAAPIQTPATEPLSPEAAGAPAESGIRIIADRRNSALLIYATPSEYSVIEGMLRKIDIVPLQVLIEATIAEVTLNDALQYGTQFFFTANHVDLTLGATPTLPTGFAGFAVSKSPHFLLQALADVTQVRVLSAPRLLVFDNEPARLQVGQEVPILTGTATSTLAAGAPIVNSIDYHSTGVIMDVTPRVNSGGLVTLDIAQEVSDVAPPAVNTATGSPTFDDRIVRTRLAVQDGQTVGVAGLIHDTVQEENSGLPFLKDIPLIGSLLSTQNNKRMRTELLVLITPHVVHDQRDARALTVDLRNELINAGVVPQALQRKGPSGSHNPNGL